MYQCFLDGTIALTISSVEIIRNTIKSPASFISNYFFLFFNITFDYSITFLPFESIRSDSVALSTGGYFHFEFDMVGAKSSG